MKNFLVIFVTCMTLTGCLGIKTFKDGIEVYDQGIAVEKLLGVRNYWALPKQRFQSSVVNSDIACIGGVVWKPEKVRLNTNWVSTKYTCKVFRIED